jgi:hypothetical protein
MKYARSIHCAEVMVVTPEIATEMLATSTGNRKEHQSNIRFLCKALRRYTFKFSGQGITFDLHGHLRDGHHRLRSIQSTGIPVELTVAMGCDEDIYLYLDSGDKRTAGDHIGCDRRVAEVVRLAATKFYGDNRPQGDMLNEIHNSDLGYTLEMLIQHTGARTRYYSSAGMKLAAALHITLGKENEAEYALDQYDALCKLDHLRWSAISGSLHKTVSREKPGATMTTTILCRGLKVFDIKNKDKILRVSPYDIENTSATVRDMIGTILSG